MLALSIRQPWAWLILHGGKDVENRTWRTPLRGRIAIHAAKTCTESEYQQAVHFVRLRFRDDTPEIPARHELLKGGIVGHVDIVGCVDASESKWFVGPYGLLLANPQVVPFRACRGTLGFFTITEAR